MPIDVGALGKTVRMDATPTPNAYVVAGNDNRSLFLLISSDRVVHLALDVGDATHETGFCLPEREVARVQARGGQSLFFVVGEGEPDGHVWITEIR